MTLLRRISATKREEEPHSSGLVWWLRRLWPLVLVLAGLVALVLLLAWPR
jgi:hypothetical protein